MIMALGELERKVISWREGRQLVDELCVLVGAKPERLQEKIDELKTIQ